MGIDDSMDVFAEHGVAGMVGLLFNAYTFVVSALIAYAINFIPGLHLRASEEAELLGMDDDQLGEFAYDYVEVRRDYLAWTPATGEQNGEGHNIPQGERHGIAGHSQMLEGKEPSESSVDHQHPVAA